jgi:hypothetical protein
MVSSKDVSNHHDVSRAVGSANPSHAHPHDAVPVRVSKESRFAAPGLDVPVRTEPTCTGDRDG